MKLFAFVLSIMVALAAYGGNDADSVKVHFRAGQYRFDPSLGDNERQMERCLATLKTYAESDIDSIVIRAYTSPDGTSDFNELLSRQRCDAISDYIIANSGIERNLIRKHPEGIAWDGLRTLVAGSPGVPSRDAVLEIIEKTPVWVFDANGKVVDGRKSRLMSLERGVPYNWMLKHLFPELRNAVAIVVVARNGLPEESEESEQPELMEGLELSESPESPESPELMEGSEELMLSDAPGNPDDPDNSDKPDIYHTAEDKFALKTNLLYYAALMPNLELEWRINRRWSVAIEGDVAWWSKGLRKYRLAVVTPEVRYRFMQRGDAWKGMYVGLFIGPGLYDLENMKNGYRGEGVMVGASWGYSWPIARRLSLEAGVGVGYIYTRYKEYMPLGGHFLYQRTKDMNYFGPLRLRLALVWRFGHKRVKTNTKSVI